MMKWLASAVLLLLLVAVDARGERRRNQYRSYRVSGSGNCQNVQAWSPNRVYEYNYEAAMKHTDESQDESPQQMTLSCKVKMAIQRRCNAVMSLENCRIEGTGQSSSSGQHVEKLMTNDAAVSFNAGEITGLEFHRDEDLDVKNIKRGILTALQMQFSSIPQGVSPNHSFMQSETGINGVGPVKYIVEEVSQRYASVVEVIRDSNKMVLPWERNHMSTSFIKAEGENPLTSVVNEYIKKSFAKSIPKQVQVCRYGLERGRTITTVDCVEEHTMESKDHFWRRLATSFWTMNITVEQKLRQNTVEKIRRQDKTAIDTSSMKSSDMMFEIRWEDIEGNKNVPENMEKLFLTAILNEPVNGQTPKMLAELERWMVSAPRDEIQQLWRDCSRELRESQRLKANAVWVELLSGCSSRYWCNSIGEKNCTSSNPHCEVELKRFVNSIANLENNKVINSVINSLAEIPNPDEPTISVAHTICRVRTTEENVRALGKVLKNYLSYNPQPQGKEALKAKMFIVSIIGEGCSSSSYESKIQVEALLSMKFMGTAFESYSDKVMACAQSTSVPRVVTSAALSCLSNVTGNELKPRIKSEIMRMLTERSTPMETKILCYNLLVKKSLSSNEIDRIITHVLTQSTEEVKDYVEKHLRTNVMLRNTRYCSVNPDVIKLIHELLVGGRFSIGIEVEELRKEPTEKVESFEQSVYVPYLDMDIPCAIKYSLVYMDSTELPTIATANVTAKIEGKEMQIAEVGIDILSLRAVVENNMNVDLTRPEGLFQILNLPVEEIFSRAFSFNRRYENELRGLEILQDKARYGYINGIMKTSKPFYVTLFGQELQWDSLFKSLNVRNFLAGNLWQILSKIENGFKQSFTAKYNTPIITDRVLSSSMGVPIYRTMSMSCIYKGESDIKANLMGVRWSDVATGYADIAQTIKTSVVVTHSPLTRLCENCLKPAQIEIQVGHVSDFSTNITKQQNEISFEVFPRTQNTELISLSVSKRGITEPLDIRTECTTNSLLGACKINTCTRWKTHNKQLSINLESEDLTPRIIHVRWGEKRNIQSSQPFQREFLVEVSKKGSSAPCGKLSISNIPQENTLECTLAIPEESIQWKSQANAFLQRNSQNQVEGLFCSCNVSSWSSPQPEYRNTLLISPASSGNYEIKGGIECPVENEKKSYDLTGTYESTTAVRSLECKLTESSGSVFMYYSHKVTKSGDGSYNVDGLHYGDVSLLNSRRQAFKYIAQQEGTQYKEFAKFTSFTDKEGQSIPVYVLSHVTRQENSQTSYNLEYTHANSWFQFSHKAESSDEPQLSIKSIIYIPESAVPLHQVENGNEAPRLVRNETHPGIQMIVSELQMDSSKGLVNYDSVYQYKDNITDEVQQLEGQVMYQMPEESCPSCHSLKIKIPGVEIQSENSNYEGRQTNSQRIKIDRTLFRKMISLPETIESFLSSVQDDTFTLHYNYTKVNEPKSWIFYVNLLDNEMHTNASYNPESRNELITASSINVGVPFWNTKTNVNTRYNHENNEGEVNCNSNSSWGGISYQYKLDTVLSKIMSRNDERTLISKLYNLRNYAYEKTHVLSAEISGNTKSMEGEYVRYENGEPVKIQPFVTKYKDQEGNIISHLHYCSSESDTPCYKLAVSIDNPDKIVYKMISSDDEENSIKLSKIGNEWICKFDMGNHLSSKLENLEIKFSLGPIAYSFDVNNDNIRWSANMENRWVWGLYFKNGAQENLKKISFNTNRYTTNSTCIWNYEDNLRTKLESKIEIENKILMSILDSANHWNLVYKYIPGMYEFSIEHPDARAMITLKPRNPRTDVEYKWICDVESRPNLFRIKQITVPLPVMSGEPQQLHIRDAQINCPSFSSCGINDLTIECENIYSKSKTSIQGSAFIRDNICSIKLSDQTRSKFDIDVKLPVNLPLPEEQNLEYFCRVLVNHSHMKANVIHEYLKEANSFKVKLFNDYVYNNEVSETPVYSHLSHVEYKLSTNSQNVPAIDLGCNYKTTSSNLIHASINITNDEVPTCITTVKSGSKKLVDTEIKLQGCTQRVSGYENLCWPKTVVFLSKMYPVTSTNIFYENSEENDEEYISASGSLQFEPCQQISRFYEMNVCLRSCSINDGSLIVPQSAWEKYFPLSTRLYNIDEEGLNVRNIQFKFLPEVVNGQTKLLVSSQGFFKEELCQGEMEITPEVFKLESRLPILEMLVKNSLENGESHWIVDIETPELILKSTIEMMKEITTTFKTKGMLRNMMTIDFETSFMYQSMDDWRQTFSYNTTMINNYLQCGNDMSFFTFSLPTRSSYSSGLIAQCHRAQGRTTQTTHWDCNAEIGDYKQSSTWEVNGMVPTLKSVEITLPQEEIRNVVIKYVDVSSYSRKCTIVMEDASGNQYECSTSAMSSDHQEGNIICRKGSQTIVSQDIEISQIPFLDRKIMYDLAVFAKKIWKVIRYTSSHSIEEIVQSCDSEAHIHDRQLCSSLAKTAKSITFRKSEMIDNMGQQINAYATIVSHIKDNFHSYVRKVNSFDPTNTLKVLINPRAVLSASKTPFTIDWGRNGKLTFDVQWPSTERDSLKVECELKSANYPTLCLTGSTEVRKVENGWETVFTVKQPNQMQKLTWLIGETFRPKSYTGRWGQQEINVEFNPSSPITATFSKDSRNMYECEFSVPQESWSNSHAFCYKLTDTGKQSIGQISFPELPKAQKLMTMLYDNNEMNNYFRDIDSIKPSIKRHIKKSVQDAKNDLIKHIVTTIASLTADEKYSRYMSLIPDKLYSAETWNVFSEDPNETLIGKLGDVVNSLPGQWSESILDILRQVQYLFEGKLFIKVKTDTGSQCVSIQITSNNERMPALNTEMTVRLSLTPEGRVTVDTSFNHASTRFYSNSSFVNEKVASNVTIDSENLVDNSEDSNRVVTKHITLPNGKQEIRMNITGENNAFFCRCHMHEQNDLHFKCYKDNDEDDETNNLVVARWTTKLSKLPLTDGEPFHKMWSKMIEPSENDNDAEDTDGDDESEDEQELKSLLRDHWRARYHSFHNKFEQPDDLDNEDDIENDKIRTIRESTNYIVRLITDNLLDMTENDQSPWEASIIKNIVDFTLQLCKPVMKPFVVTCLHTEAGYEFDLDTTHRKKEVDLEFNSAKYPILNWKYDADCQEGRCSVNFENHLLTLTDVMTYETSTMESLKIKWIASQAAVELIPQQSSMNEMIFRVTLPGQPERKCAMKFFFSPTFCKVYCYNGDMSQRTPVLLANFELYNFVELARFAVSHYSNPHVEREEVVRTIERMCQISDSSLKASLIKCVLTEVNKDMELWNKACEVVYKSSVKVVPGLSYISDTSDMYSIITTLYRPSSQSMKELYLETIKILAKVTSEYQDRYDNFVHSVVMGILKSSLNPSLMSEIEHVFNMEQATYVFYKLFSPVGVSSTIKKTQSGLEIIPFNGEKYYKLPTCALESQYLLATDAVGQSFSLLYGNGKFTIVLPTCQLEMTEDFRLHHRSLNGESRELSLPFEDNEEIMTRCFRDNNSSFVCLTHNITVIMHTSESMKGITHVLVGQNCLKNTAGLLGSPNHPVQEKDQKVCGVPAISYRDFVESAIITRASSQCQIDTTMRNSSISREVSSRICEQVFEPAMYVYNAVPVRGYLKACEDNCQTKEEACEYASKYIDSCHMENVPVPFIKMCKPQCESESPRSQQIEKVEVNIILPLCRELPTNFPEIKSTLNQLVQAMRSNKQSSSQNFAFRLMTVGGKELMYVPQIHAKEGKELFPFSENWNIPFESQIMAFNGPPCTRDSIARSLRDAYHVSSRGFNGVSKIILIASPLEEVHPLLSERVQLKKLLEEDVTRTFVLSPSACRSGARSSGNSKFGLQPIFTSPSEQAHCYPTASSAAEYLLSEEVTRVGRQLQCGCRVINWFTGEAISECRQN